MLERFWAGGQAGRQAGSGMLSCGATDKSSISFRIQYCCVLAYIQQYHSVHGCTEYQLVYQFTRSV